MQFADGVSLLETTMFSHRIIHSISFRPVVSVLATAAAALALAWPSPAMPTVNRPPEFQGTPCGQVLVANVDVLFSFEVEAWAANGIPEDTVMLTVTGDATVLASATFTPPMPVGPAQPAHTLYQWSPSALDVGTWHLHFAATDQLGQVTSCVVTIEVPPPSFLSFCMPTENGVMACPCTNRGNVGHGCNNSADTGGALLVAMGVASLGSDTLHFVCSGELPNATSILLQAQGPATTGVQFGQGVRCVNNTLKRLYTQQAVGGMVTYPQGSDLPVHTQSAARGDGLFIGAERYYLSYYRDPTVVGTCTPGVDTFNASQGVKVTWVP